MIRAFSHRWNRLGFLSVGTLLLFAGICPRAQATLILNDSFSDGSRTNQSLPNSANWVTGGPSSNASVTNGALTFADASAGQATAMTYFNAVNLQVGQSLTLSFDYNFTQVANADNSLMFGLYNSGGSYVTTDGLGFNNSIFNSYTGYATSGVFGADPSGTGRDHIEARNNLGNNLLSIATYSEGPTTIQSGAATPGQTYTAWMQISRTAAGITVASTIGNTTLSQQFTSNFFTKFDTVGIFSNGNTGSLTLDNIKLDYAGVPEPPPFLAMGILAATVFGRVAGRKVQGVIPRLQMQLRSFIA